MSRKKRIFLWVFLSVLLLVGAGALVPGIRVRVLGLLAGEAFFDGRPASAWSQDLASEAEAKEKPAFDRLKRAGKAAQPVLMDIAFQADSPGRNQAQAVLARQGETALPPLVKALKKPATEDRKQAALILGAMGAKAQRAVGQLARLLEDNDEQVRRAGMTALEKIGPQAGEAIPDLIQILEGKGSTDTDWLAHAAKVVGQIGPQAREAVPALTACLNNSDEPLKRQACLALARMGKEALPAVPALIEVVKNRLSPARAAAALALGQVGPGAKLAVPTLIAVLAETTNAPLREASKDALGKMGPEARPAVPALLAAFGTGAPIRDIGAAAFPELIRLLVSPKQTIQADAKFFLELFRKETTPVMLQALEKDNQPAVRRALAGMLGPDWGEPNVLLPPLLQALQDKDNAVRQAARSSILAFKKTAQPFLEQQLRGKSDPLRLESAQLLGRLGRPARSSAPLLLAVLKQEKEKNPQLCLAAVRALASMDFHPKEAVPILIAALKTRNRTDLTLAQLAVHGRAAKDAVPLICMILEDSDWKLRRQAAFALERIGVDNETCLPALKKALNDKHELVRAAAAQALGGTAFAAAEVVPLLTKLLEDSSRAVQGAAILAMGKLGRPAQAAVPLIHKLARATNEQPEDKEFNLRLTCVKALGGIGPPAKETVPLLLSWLPMTKSELARAEIIQALGQMRAMEAIKVLKPLVEKGKGSEAVMAALALWRIEKSPAALACLQDGLKDKGTRAPFIIALGRVGPGAQKAVPLLTDILLRDKDLHHRALAAEALGRIGPAARPAIKALTESLRLPHAGARIQAARALAQFEEEAKDAVPRLVDLLNDPESPELRQAAADALLDIDPEAAAREGL